MHNNNNDSTNTFAAHRSRTYLIPSRANNDEIFFLLFYFSYVLARYLCVCQSEFGSLELDLASAYRFSIAHRMLCMSEWLGNNILS